MEKNEERAKRGNERDSPCFWPWVECWVDLRAVGKNDACTSCTRRSLGFLLQLRFKRQNTRNTIPLLLVHLRKDTTGPFVSTVTDIEGDTVGHACS